MIIKRLHLLTVLVACCLTALEADGARRLWNESFFSVPQLKRDSLGRPCTLLAGCESSQNNHDARVVAVCLVAFNKTNAPWHQSGSVRRRIGKMLRESRPESRLYRSTRS